MTTSPHDATQVSSSAEAAVGTSACPHPVMGLLAGHVPISLLVDLAQPAGPRSAEILVDEGAPPEHWWEQP